MNNLETILKLFEKMDIKGLEVILNDDIDYQHTSKEIFLKELETIFKQFKKTDDTFLTYIPYDSEEILKSFNNNKKGYLFVGNNSKNFSYFIFQINRNEIVNIYSNSLYNEELRIDNLNKQNHLYIDYEDRTIFDQSHEYWIKRNGAQKALEEIITKPYSVVNLKFIKSWLIKHCELYAQIGQHHERQYRFMKWNHFTFLFRNLNEGTIYIDTNYKKVNEAIQLLKTLKTEQEKINWILNYEDLYNSSPFFVNHHIHREDDKVVFAKGFPFIFKGKKLINTASFLFDYHELHNILFEKYNIYTPEEFIAMEAQMEGVNDYVNISVLRYHIEKREEMKRIGFDISFPSLES